MKRKWEVQTGKNHWFSLGLHIDHEDPSITFHLPGIIIVAGNCKQPGFKKVPKSPPKPKQIGAKRIRKGTAQILVKVEHRADKRNGFVTKEVWEDLIQFTGKAHVGECPQCHLQTNWSQFKKGKTDGTKEGSEKASTGPTIQGSPRKHQNDVPRSSLT